MKVNISFKYFSQNVSVGYCLILLGMTIAGAYAAVIRPDMRWILILMVFFTDFFACSVSGEYAGPMTSAQMVW